VSISLVHLLIGASNRRVAVRGTLFAVNHSSPDDDFLDDGPSLHYDFFVAPRRVANAASIRPRALIRDLPLGTGIGIGNIGARAVESVARQPEMTATIQNLMILSAALIEGAAFASLIFCFIKC